MRIEWMCKVLPNLLKYKLLLLHSNILTAKISIFWHQLFWIRSLKFWLTDLKIVVQCELSSNSSISNLVNIREKNRTQNIGICQSNIENFYSSNMAKCFYWPFALCFKNGYQYFADQILYKKIQKLKISGNGHKKINFKNVVDRFENLRFWWTKFDIFDRRKTFSINLSIFTLR